MEATKQKKAVSPAKLAANRANAQHSTGPKTEEGKRKSAYNAWQHGLCAPIGNNDLWIGAHAMALDVTVATNNEREFKRIAGLAVENWTK